MPRGFDAPRARLYPDLRPSRPLRLDDEDRIAAFFRRRVQLFRRVPEAVVRGLAADAFCRRYAGGEYVCRTGDPAREIWVVQEGRLCVNQCGWSGNRLSIEVMVPGDLSGLASVACRTYPGEVIAARDAALIVIPRASMLRMIEKHPELGREILYAYGQRLHYIETLLYLSREKVEKRLIAALLYLYHKFGFALPLTRAEIGQMAGTTAETTMRVLKRLEDQGLLQRHKRKVVIGDLSRLKALSGLS